MNELSDIYNNFSNINYGWLDINNELHVDSISDFTKLYRVSTYDEINNKRIGSCFDQVEYLRYLLKDKYNTKSYAYLHHFMIHAILSIEYDSRYIYFENISEDEKGIHVFNSNDELLEFGYYIFMSHNGIKHKEDIVLIEYDELKPFMTFCDIKTYFLTKLNDNEKKLILR